jgi:hypothetical protein
VNHAVPVQMPKPLAELQPQRQRAGHAQPGCAELVAQRFAFRKIRHQKWLARVRAEVDDGGTALVPQAAQGARLALEPRQLAAAFNVALVPELESGGPPIVDRLGPKGGAMLRRAKGRDQAPASPDDLMKKGVGPRIHCRSSID